MRNIKIIDLNFLDGKETIASFLLETSEGPALFETGPHSTLPSLEKGLKEFGYRLEDVRHVFLTHIHLDHAGAAWVFAEKGAQIYVHPFGARHLNQPEKLLESAKRIYKDEMDRLWGTLKPIPAEQIVEVPQAAEYTLGGINIRAWHTPGHAVHHIAWQVDQVLFTGDVAGVKIQDGPVAPPCPPPDINLEDWKTSLDLIRTLDIENMYLTHFGIIEKHQFASHLHELEESLLSWASWIKPYWEKGVHPKEVTPLFQAYVQKEMKQKGCSDHQIHLYENANPSWMSVAGLMRYWRKKAEREGSGSGK
jgi:glyoxylase-like metal-dependent hydrolase (beta-lactamase superfamily II)